MGELVEVVREPSGVARVIMHRGGHNAIAGDLLGELADSFRELGAEAGVRALVLQSALERYFSVGADLGEMAAVDLQGADAEDRIAQAVAARGAALAVIEACPKPVIARINGHALGGGCELALCCDYRVMVDDGRARIGQTEAALGLVPGFGGTQRLVRLIGRARALPMLYEASRLSAPEALAVGLVHRAVSPAELDEVVDELAGRLARGATVALSMIKDAVLRGADLPLGEGLAVEARNFARAALSEDAVTGVVSFLQKQEPEFRGR